MKSRLPSLCAVLMLLIFGYCSCAVSAKPDGQSTADETIEKYKRHRIEQMFGKYYGSYNGFDIYGITKHDGSWDRDDDSTISGVIVAPKGSHYSHVELKAELKFNTDWLYGSKPTSNKKQVIETLWTSTTGGWDTNKLNVAPAAQKPHYEDICHTSFRWECPRSVDPTTLHITALVAK